MGAVTSDNLAKLLVIQAERQEQSFGIDFEGMDTAERVEFIHWNVTALVDELHEALAETSWKPWAKGTFLNREAFLGELVDAQHFLNNLYLIIGAESEEITFRYLEKSSINAKRQADGYDGVSTKCPVCSRALDDPAVLCTPSLIETLGPGLCWAAGPSEEPTPWPVSRG